jgi:hypothetical protein
MITAIVTFRLSPGETQAQALEEIRKTVPLYRQAAPALLRKAIHLDAESGVGRSVYLWQDRASAERFFEMARANIKARTGHEPEIQYLDCHVLVDNVSGEVSYF